MKCCTIALILATVFAPSLALAQDDSERPPMGRAGAYNLTFNNVMSVNGKPVGEPENLEMMVCMEKAQTSYDTRLLEIARSQGCIPGDDLSFEDTSVATLTDAQLMKYDKGHHSARKAMLGDMVCGGAANGSFTLKSAPGRTTLFIEIASDGMTSKRSLNADFVSVDCESP